MSPTDVNFKCPIRHINFFKISLVSAGNYLADRVISTDHLWCLSVDEELCIIAQNGFSVMMVGGLYYRPLWYLPVKIGISCVLVQIG